MRRMYRRSAALSAAAGPESRGAARRSMSVCPTGPRGSPDSGRRRVVRRCDDVLAPLSLTPELSRSARKIARDPLGFAAQTLRAFRANQGLLLAGGVAYYTLLSIVPLMILLVIILSHVIDADRLMATLARYLEIVVPGQSAPLIEELRGFIAHREVIGWTLAVTLVFFSSLAFSVLENAMSVIFYHRVLAKRRPIMVSVLIPYLYILILGIGLLVVTVVAGALQSLALTTLDFLGRDWSMSGVSRALLYLIGVVRRGAGARVDLFRHAGRAAVVAARADRRRRPRRCCGRSRATCWSGISRRCRRSAPSTAR